MGHVHLELSAIMLMFLFKNPENKYLIICIISMHKFHYLNEYCTKDSDCSDRKFIESIHFLSQFSTSHIFGHAAINVFYCQPKTNW